MVLWRAAAALGVTTTALASLSALCATTVYRGFAGPSAWETRRGLPTFTDCRDVAQVYADGHHGGRVEAYRLAVTRPLQLGDLTEDVVEIGALREALATVGDDLEAWIAAQSFWRFGGDDFDFEAPPATDDDGNPFELCRAYTDTFRVADNPAFVALAARAGFDGFVYRGSFTSPAKFRRDVTVVEAESSYEDATLSCLEFRPFSPSQILPAAGGAAL